MKKLKIIACSIILVTGIFLSVDMCDKNKKEILKEQETPKGHALQDSIIKDSICPECELHNLSGQNHSCNTL